MGVPTVRVTAQKGRALAVCPVRCTGKQRKPHGKKSCGFRYDSSPYAGMIRIRLKGSVFRLSPLVRTPLTFIRLWLLCFGYLWQLL